MNIRLQKFLESEIENSKSSIPHEYHSRILKLSISETKPQKKTKHIHKSSQLRT